MNGWPYDLTADDLLKALWEIASDFTWDVRPSLRQKMQAPVEAMSFPSFEVRVRRADIWCKYTLIVTSDWGSPSGVAKQMVEQTKNIFDHSETKVSTLVIA
jgi:hypothetical protein